MAVAECAGLHPALVLFLDHRARWSGGAGLARRWLITAISRQGDKRGRSDKRGESRRQTDLPENHPCRAEVISALGRRRTPVVIGWSLPIIESRTRQSRSGCLAALVPAKT